MQKIIDKIAGSFKLTEKDTGKFANLRKGPMTFHIRQFDGGKIGNISTIQASGMMGLMKMDTLVINPMKIDLPLFSYDFINAMGNLTMITELYDTLRSPAFDTNDFGSVKASIASISDHDLGKHWYDDLKLSPSFSKKTKKKDLEVLEAAFNSYLEIYLDMASRAQIIEDESEKRKKAGIYVQGLLSHGGPSTDAFVKMLGFDETQILFKKIVFGTEA